jgi:DNA uptake protein ComE-like DNA-binding protein
MRGLLTFLVVAVACWSTPAAAAELGVLTPVIENGKPLQKADARGHKMPVVTQVRSGALYDMIQKEATQGATAVTLAIDELAQRKAGATHASTTWLFLAVEDGGFARKGFWLRPVHDDRERPDGRDRPDRSAPEEDSTDRFVPDLYVDLVVDANSVADGSFEEIFAHEMGHVFLRRLLPRLPDGYSRAAHMSLTVTDNPTAFDEGFATHMQGLMRRITQNESLRNQDLGLEQKPFLGWWLSRIDGAHRIDGVRRNWFVQAQIPLPGAGDAVARRDQSTLFDTAHLKNGNQMMASEGVIATLFYRWLVPGSTERAAVLERYAQMFDALVMLNRQPPINQKLDPDAPFFLDLLDAYRKTNAKDAARVLAMMIDTTYGATADASLSPQFEVLAAHGRTGDMSAFTSDLKVARAALARLQDSVAKSPEKARAALGPSVWLFRDKPSALAVNLNTAEREQLMQLPGVDSSAADRALESRRARGPFKDLPDFARRASLSAMAVTQLNGMIEAMTKAGTYARE